MMINIIIIKSNESQLFFFFPSFPHIISVCKIFLVHHFILSFQTLIKQNNKKWERQLITDLCNVHLSLNLNFQIPHYDPCRCLFILFCFFLICKFAINVEIFFFLFLSLFPSKIHPLGGKKKVLSQFEILLFSLHFYLFIFFSSHKKKNVFSYFLGEFNKSIDW